jgi:hypothetical protein
MASCRTCGKKFPFFTICKVKHPNPLGDGYLCTVCYGPYGLVLEKYSTTLKDVHTNPKSAAWVAVCYLMAAQRLNLRRTVTAAIIGISETQSSWEVCRQSAAELATAAKSMLPPNAEGQGMLRGILDRVETMTESPPREIPIQRHASVWGDTIAAIEYDALMRSGISIDELNSYIASLPGHRWLLTP